ncbi:hypothetical protein DID80_03840 [Candidatus Marinamargulisbacteria bacterium SCGC AAA071-K20]|nr:hypothetical protein DID80_03840 [Candidatus Marinamargulisbacteria bacterium SCGC AAA071-K20]
MSKTSNALKKVAIFMMNIEMESPGASQKVFDLLGEEVSKDILHEMSALQVVDSQDSDEVIQEFHAIMDGDKEFYGGKTIPNAIYKNTFNGGGGRLLFDKKSELFSFMKRVPEDKLLPFLEAESPQLVAAILTFMDEESVSQVLSKLSKERVIIISESLLKTDIPSMRLMWNLHYHISDYFNDQKEKSKDVDSPVDKLARSFELMNDTDRADIMTYLDRSQKSVADQIKSRMLTFDDLVAIPEEDLQTILYEIESMPDLAMALVASSNATQELVKVNVSARLQSILDEEIAMIKDPDQKDIQQAQHLVVSLARQLEKNGKIGALSSIKKASLKLNIELNEEKNSHD